MLLQQPANATMIPQGEERKLAVRFYTRAVQNAAKTAAAGRPICDQHVYVEIRVPGDRGNITDRRATEQDYARFPAAYERFNRGQEQPTEGTPLEQWPILNVAEVAELKAMNILSVETLAGLPDGVADRYMGLRTYRQKAQTFLKAAGDSAYASQMATELERRDEEIARLKGEVETLARKLESVLREAPAARQPKREAA